MQDRFRDLFVRLAADRFNLVVASRFNRGRSSLMNAVRGMDRLPIGIVPLASIITTVSYGTREKVTLQYQQRRLGSEISLEELPEYITQQGTREQPHCDRKYPAESLRRGFYFVDVLVRRQGGSAGAVLLAGPRNVDCAAGAVARPNMRASDDSALSQQHVNGAGGDGPRP
jgi:hypothetical protein